MSPERLLAYRLIRLIETNSEQLAATLLERAHTSDRTKEYIGRVPVEDLNQRVVEIYRHLRQWLQDASEQNLEQRYREIGALRVRQGVPLKHVIWAIVLVKEVLFDFLKKETTLSQPAELAGQLEVVELLDRFFDHATYFAASGYEQALAENNPRNTRP